jgi:hypothetical protein
MLQRSANWMAFFNEAMVSVYLYVSIALSGVSANTNYNNCGTALMGVIVLTASVSFLYFLSSVV